MDENKKTVFSGIQPSGSPTIGNYIGAIRNYVALQEEYDCFYSVVDMHAITVRQNPAELRNNSRNLTALLIACGVDPDKCTLFVQSHVTAHAELCWILNCFTYMGELSRMIQFKEKSKGNETSVSVGLFDYPVLQVADILLYQTDLVPIGADQKQHLEITRDVAIRFNNTFSPTFKIPEILIPKVGARVMSINDPTKKMSKSSDDPNSYILILDKPEDIKRKIKRAITDSDNEIYFDEGKKPGVSNLITIYSTMTGKNVEQSVNDLSTLGGYGAFKDTVADAVVAALEPIQKKYAQLSQDKAYIDKVLYDNAMKASKVANKTLSKVKRKVGFTDLPRPH